MDYFRLVARRRTGTRDLPNISNRASSSRMAIMSLFDLTGQVALVTGGSRGLGLQMVLAFADAGADVVIASRKLDACRAAAEKVQARGRRALPIACHVG